MSFWKEELPEGCPPAKATKPTGKVFYRLSYTNPPTEKDLTPSRKPIQTVTGINNECLICSLSVWDNLEKCKSIAKLPTHKKPVIYVMELALNSNDGEVLQTFRENHYSWWRSLEFSISNIQLVIV